MRSTIVPYNGDSRRKPIPRPIPRKLCNIRSIKRIRAINWIESNGPHGKFMATREDYSLSIYSIYYAIIDLKMTILGINQEFQSVFKQNLRKANFLI